MVTLSIIENIVLHDTKQIESFADIVEKDVGNSLER